MTLVNQYCLYNRSPCKSVRQSTPLASKIRYLLVPCPFRKENTKVGRVGHGPGNVGRQTSPRLRPLLCRHRYDAAQKTVIRDFKRDRGMMSMNPYGVQLDYLSVTSWDIVGTLS